MAAAYNARMKTSDYFGQRPGLFDLPPVAVTELAGNEFGVNLTHRELTLIANEKLRQLQAGGGVLNVDSGDFLKINKKGRKKMGDNEGQSDVELRAIAGIESLVRHAVVAERHLDYEHHNPDVESVLRLYAPLQIAGSLYRVRLTVKNYKAGNNMLHALAAIEIENAPLGTLPAYSVTEVIQQGQPTTGRTITVADLLKNATLYDGSVIQP